MNIQRTIYLELIKKYFRVFPVCAILGARQVGKTTLSRQFATQNNVKIEHFDLENPLDLERLKDPMITLSQYDDRLIIIDEIQRRPDLFTVLRVLVDHPEKKYRFLILGSASQELIRQSSETLAGRIGYIELPSFTFFDLQPTINNKLLSTDRFSEISKNLILRGGFPRSYLAETEEDSLFWRKGYINTFLERDLPSFGFNISPQTMHKFWMMLCFYHGQSFNASEIATALMISHKTASSYLDILAGTFMVRVLQPWYENIKKRQVRTPKIYFRDSGIFNYLAGIQTFDDLARTPKIGALWEGFALEQVISCLQIPTEDCYFWATSNEAELDLFVFQKGKRIGFEFKYTDAPKTTKSMHIALEDLKLDHLYVIYPGIHYFDMNEKITACGFEVLHNIKI